MAAFDFHRRKWSESNAIGVCTALVRKHGTMKRVAEFLKIDYSHVWKAERRNIATPTLMQALVDAGLMEPRQTRVRIAFDTDADTRARIRAAQKRLGHDDAGVCELLLEVLENCK